MLNFIKSFLIALSFVFCSLSIAPSVNAQDISYKNVRVGILTEVPAVVASLSAKGAIFDESMNKISDISPLQPCTITSKNGILEIFLNNKTFMVTEGKLILKNIEKKEKYTPLVYAGRIWYRGYLEIFPSFKNNKSLTVVNVLPLEEYLYGVVPSEMPSSWPVEALKTQAVAARTYVLRHLGQYGKEGFDVMPTVASQVYGGVQEETAPTNQAVNETRGEVVTYNSKLISAYYFSSGGGMTENGEDVWGTSIPYLKAVPDFDQESPKYMWYKTINNDELQNILKKEFEIQLGRITKITVTDTTASNRVKTIRIDGTDASVDIDGKKFRMAAKLNSTFFRVDPVEIGTTIENNIVSPNLFMFVGKGWGHGAGLSQWGARYLAKVGKKYGQILRYYYQGTEISDANSILGQN